MAKNGTPTNTALDPLISSSLATTSLAVESKLDALLEMVSPPSSSTGNTNIDSTLNKIRSDLDGLTSAQSSEQEQIKKLLGDALNREVWEQLTKEIETQINEHIDKNVATLVDQQLDRYISKELRERVDNQRADMQALHVEIHNSEARRANSFVKNQKQFNEPLQHLLNGKGAVCGVFPRTVNGLLAMEDGKVIDLVTFYAMEGVDTKSKFPNINWFLRHIGVGYQPHFLG